MCADCDVQVDLKTGEMWNPRRGKLRRFRRELFLGLGYGYPICCVFRFSFDAMLLDGKILSQDMGMAARRGSIVRNNDVDDVFVPCNIFHYKNHEWTDIDG